MVKSYAVIMAGGVGARFWPRSRERSPKQLLEIIDKESLLRSTVRRLSGLMDQDRVYIVTNKTQKSLIQKHISELSPHSLIIEPLGRNTAACIGLAALHVKKADPKAVMVVLPADHIIDDVPEFHRVVRLAVEVADESGSLITIGIHPTHPETGYGYIQMIDEDDGTNPYFTRGVFKVKTFAEKPNVPTAERFIESGDFLWNSGMFVWRTDAILQEIQRRLPDLHRELSNIEPSLGTDKYQSTLDLAYGMIRGISIDYGVMEKTDRAYVIRGKFGWSDVGSWDELYRLAQKDAQGNHATGKVLLKETKNTLIHSVNQFVAAVGVENLIIVATDDAVLVCKRERSQDVKEIVDYLKRKQMNDYL